MFAKTGSFFLTKNQYTIRISTALHMELGETHQATKTLMRWTNANERTVKNWLSGSNGPSGEHLVELVKHSDIALAVFLEMAERPCSMAASELPLLRQKLQSAIDGIDRCLEQGKVQFKN